jgi:hypothetical protein
MSPEDTKRVVELVRTAQEIASSNGINILQPGLIKELVIAESLGHVVYPSKHGKDASSSDGKDSYEYLTCKAGGTFQFDRMFKSPPEKRAKSLNRITRNKNVYCVVFDDPLVIKEVWDIPITTLTKEIERQLDSSKNDISHVSVSIKWVHSNGARVV